MEKIWETLLDHEKIGHATINTLEVPQFNFGKIWTLTEIMGLSFLLIVGIWVIGSRLFPALRKNIMPFITIFFIFLQYAYIIIRFVPVLKLTPFLSDEKKLFHYPFAESLGQLIVRSRELIPVEDKVLIHAAPGDWYGPQTIAFNLAPRLCGFTQKDNDVWEGISGVTSIIASSADWMIFFHSDASLPLEYKITEELQKNVFIAQKVSN